MKTNSQKLTPKKMRIVAVMMLAFVIFITGIVIAYTFLSFRIKGVMNSHIEESTDLNFSKIEKYINQLYTDAANQSEVVGKSMQTDIYRKYDTKESLGKLKADLNNDDYDDLADIAYMAIKNIYLNGVNNERNSLFVATNKVILCDLNYELSSTSSKDNYSTWKVFVDNNYNEILAKNATYSLTHVPNDLVFIEPSKSENGNHTYESTISMDKLEDIYKKEGIEGLKNYQLLVPYYIKDKNTDIFDDNELVKGVQHDTYRIMVVQRCNIYDQLMYNNRSLVENNIEKMNKDLRTIMGIVYGIGLFIVIVFVMTIVGACSVFNSQISSVSEKQSL